MSLRRRAASYAFTAVAAMFYYVFVAPGVLGTLSLAIPVGPTVSAQSIAVAWALAEAVVVVLPFVTLALVVAWWPGLLPGDIWFAPLAVVVVPSVLSALWNLWALGSLRNDFAMGEALVTELALAIDLLAALLGSALVIVVGSRSVRGTRTDSAAAHRHTAPRTTSYPRP